MLKRSLNQKMKDVVFYAVVFFVLYSIVAYLLESKWLSEIIGLPKVNGILKDSLTMTAAFLAPGAAFILFTDWREQHNKQVRNDFGLKVFTQFEKFSKEIDQAAYIHTELDCLIPDEQKNVLNSSRIPLYLSDPIFKQNHNLILSYFKQADLIQIEFSILIDKFRYYGAVTNQLIYMEQWLKNIIEEFTNIHDEVNDDYGEYLELLHLIEEKLDQYTKIRSKIERNITLNILQRLQED